MGLSKEVSLLGEFVMNRHDHGGDLPECTGDEVIVIVEPRTEPEPSKPLSQ